MLKRDENLDRVFHALSDCSRRRMIERLSSGPASVSELGRPLPMTLAAVVQHVQVLEAAGLVRTQKVGRVRRCELRAERSNPSTAGSPNARRCGPPPSTAWAVLADPPRPTVNHDEERDEATNAASSHSTRRS